MECQILSNRSGKLIEPPPPPKWKYNVSFTCLLHASPLAIVQCVATSSGDGTVKLWAVADFTCVKTFEGHTSSVLKVTFLTRGMQLASWYVCDAMVYYIIVMSLLTIIIVLRYSVVATGW